MRTQLWTRDHGLRALLACSVGVTMFYVIGWGAGTVFIVGAWIVVLVTQAAQFVLAVAIVRLPGLQPSARRFFTLLACAPVMFMVSSTVQIGAAVRDPGALPAVTGSSGRAVFIGAGALFLVAALLSPPLGLSKGRERVRFWLDATTVMIGVAGAAWSLSGIEAAARVWHKLPVAGLVNSVVGPAAMLVVIFGIVKLLLAGVAPFTRAAGAIGCVSSVIGVVSHGAAAQFVEAGRVHALMAFHILSAVTFLAAFRAQQVQVRADASVLTERQHKRPYSVLPYAAIGAIFSLLVWVLITSGLTGRAWVLLGCVIASTALVVVRQLAAFVDNQVLLGRLDTKVREMAAARDVLGQALDERNALAGQLHHLAFHDNLTGLGNRALLLDRMDEALAMARRDDRRVDLLFIDLDGFKPVNDQHGHATGDLLLREVSVRLDECVGEAGLVTRLGGDEFAVLLERYPGEIDALVDQITTRIRQPAQFANVEVRIGASIGVATCVGGASDRATLMHDADIAMYAAKNRTKYDADQRIGAQTAR
jgi:diguanylate cyclase (GGDEF)-like protein